MKDRMHNVESLLLQAVHLVFSYLITCCLYSLRLYFKHIEMNMHLIGQKVRCSFIFVESSYTIHHFIFAFFKIKSTCFFILKVLKNNWILFVDCKLTLKKSTVTQSGLRKYFDRTLISMQTVQWQLYTSCNVIPK